MNPPTKTSPSYYPYVLGLTGSIGMGKSTVASMIMKLGVPVLDSDKSVHALYAAGGRGVDVVFGMFPDAVVNGAVDRQMLSKHVLGPEQQDNMRRLESAIHPLLEAERDEFLKTVAAEGKLVALLDVPLLFEKGMEAYMDAILVVSAPSEVQKARVLSRPGMTVQKFESILGKQVPDDEKRRKAHVVIDTNRSLETVEQDVSALLAALHHQVKSE